MKHAVLLLAAACLVATTSVAFAGDPPVIIEIPMDAQINLGLPGTTDSPNGDAIYIPTWNTREYLEFRADEPDGYCRNWIQGLDPNAAGGWYYGPYIDFHLAGYGALDMSGHNSTLEYDCRYYQGPNNGDPYDDAPIGPRIYTYDPTNTTYVGHQSYEWPYQTGPYNYCDPKPTGAPQWWYTVIDLDDWTRQDFDCDGVPSSVVAGGAFDISAISRMRWYGTDWNAAVLGPCDDYIDMKNVKFTLYPPPCLADLNDDGATGLPDLAILLADYLCDGTVDNLVIDTDFNSYAIAPLPGQFGWQSGSADWDPGDPYTFPDPDVIDDPTGGGHGKVVRFDPPDGASWVGESGAYYEVAPPAAYGFVTIEFDQYRPDTGDNFYIQDHNGGWYAVEWDIDGISAARYGEGSVNLTVNVWQHITYTLNLTTNQVTVDVDGTQGTATLNDDGSFGGVEFDFVASAEVGDGPLYLDNLVITYREYCPVDFNGDSQTSLADLATLLSDYLCEPTW